MPGLYKDEGVVLRAIKLGEADRIVTIYTRGHGKVRAVAKGVRKTKSRFGGRLEPFSLVNLMIYRGRNLDTITAADVIRTHDELRCDYELLGAASAFAELVDKVTPERERAWPTYSLLLAGLEALAVKGSPSILPAFLVKLLSISGYHPHVTACAGCGSAAVAGFSPNLGGAVCAECGPDDPGAWPLPASHLALMAELLTADFGVDADPQATTAVTRTLARYAEYHLERPLKSLALLAS